MRTLNLLFLLLLSSLYSCQSKPDAQTLRFKMMADTQQRSNERALREANNIIKRLAAAVETNRYQREDVAALKQAEQIFSHTKTIIGQIQAVQAALVGYLNGKERDGALGSREIVEEVLFERKNSTSADSIRYRLRAFVAYMKPLVPQLPESLGLAPEDATHRIPGSQKADESSAYSRFYFEGISVAEALAVLAQQEAEVLQIGVEGITEQSTKVGTGLVFNKIGAYAVAESKTVRSGEKYSADLMIVTSSGAKSLRMTANGDTIPVDFSTSRGQVEFMAPKLAPGQNSVQAYWDGTISFLSYGRDTTLRVRVPYTIVK